MKMKAIMIIALALMSIACGRERKVAPELQSYVAYLEKQAALYGVEINSNDVELVIVNGSGSAAFASSCSSGRDGSAVITVNQSHWNRLSALDREILILHELGHCLLGRGHLSGYDIEHQRHISLMNPGVIVSAEFQKNREYFMKELCTSNRRD